MCHDLKSRIFQKARRRYRLSISVSAFIGFIYRVDSRLVSYLDTRDTISSQSHYLLDIEPVRTCLYRDTDDTRKCSFISFFCLFER